jgi:hypothetical protein
MVQAAMAWPPTEKLAKARSAQDQPVFLANWDTPCTHTVSKQERSLKTESHSRNTESEKTAASHRSALFSSRSPVGFEHRGREHIDIAVIPPVLALTMLYG